MKKTAIVMVVLAILVFTAQAKRLDSGDPSMTAGGYLYGLGLDGLGVKIHHTFSLDCDGATPSSLKVDWDNNVFQLDALSQPLTCTYDTVSGSGNGTLNGDPAKIWFSFTDNGEPGTNDVGIIDITDPKGATIIYLWNYLVGGNYKMH